MLAVSRKLPPALAKVSMMEKLAVLSAPQPDSVPKPMVPRQSSDTFRPVRPRSLYFMENAVVTAKVNRNWKIATDCRTEGSWVASRASEVQVWGLAGQTGVRNAQRKVVSGV